MTGAGVRERALSELLFRSHFLSLSIMPRGKARNSDQIYPNTELALVSADLPSVLPLWGPILTLAALLHSPAGPRVPSVQHLFSPIDLPLQGVLETQVKCYCVNVCPAVCFLLETLRAVKRFF